MFENSSILTALDPSQREAAIHRDGPAVVFAGAGSGKTRIITSRIALLVESGVRPWEILALTFTNKAASEMRARTIKLNPYCVKTLITTFHSASARWLREFCEELGYTSDFSIYDDQDSISTIRTIIKTTPNELDKKTSAAAVRYAINELKTYGYLPRDFKEHSAVFNQVLPAGGLEIFKAYQEKMALSNAMDFDDLLINVELLLKTNPDVRQILQERYKYILVDEFQDTNDLQSRIIRFMAGENRNIFVVGDDDQSIYSWRGAVPSNILHFDEHYLGAKKFLLSTNYRSSSHIVQSAMQMVGNNKKRQFKKIDTPQDPGSVIHIQNEADGELEAWTVSDLIKANKFDYSFADTAVFYRTNSQSRALEDALRQSQIPYQIYGTVRFYERMEIKDILSYLRLLVNPRDNLSLRRAINTPNRGIGDASVDIIEQQADVRKLSMLETCGRLVDEQMPKLAFKIKSFLDVLDAIRIKTKSIALHEMVEIVIQETGYSRYLEKKYPEQFIDKIDNLHELATALAVYEEREPNPSLSNWLQSISLSSEQSGDDIPGVTLMTLHMAKGLEFDQVFVVGLEEGVLPHQNSLEDSDAIEEERRLFYVGMTRARKKLHLFCARRRQTYDRVNVNPPSRFLSEIPLEFTNLKMTHEAVVKKNNQEIDGLRYEYTDELEAGAKVDHPAYGVGIVIGIEDNFGQKRIVVNFDEFGMRKVSLSQLSAR